MEPSQSVVDAIKIKDLANREFIDSIVILNRLVKSSATISAEDADSINRLISGCADKGNGLIERISEHGTKIDEELCETYRSKYQEATKLVNDAIDNIQTIRPISENGKTLYYTKSGTLLAQDGEGYYVDLIKTELTKLNNGLEEMLENAQKSKERALKYANRGSGTLER